MSRFAQVLIERLQCDAAPAARRLRRWPPRLSPRRASAAPVPASGQDARNADTWTLELEPVFGRAARAAAGSVHHALRVRRRRGADLVLRDADGGPLVHTIRRSARSREAICAARRGDRSASAARSATVADRRGRRAAMSSMVAGGIGFAPLRPVVYQRARPARGLRRGRRALRQPDPGRLCSSPTSSSAGGGELAGRRHGRQRAARLGRARSAWCPS